MTPLDAVVCSPPWAGVHQGTDAAFMEKMEAEQNPGPRKVGRKTLPQDYGTHPGQLGALRPGEPPAMTAAAACPVLTWAGCYDSSWKDILFPKAFAHPAKMARGLLERILDFGLAEGFWAPGDVLGDPFGGVGTTGLLAAYRGLRSISVELEPRFFGLSMATRKLHRHKMGRLGCPLPVYLRGDSRNFAALVGQVGAVVTSPPWAGVTQGTNGSFADMRSAWNADPKNAGKPGHRPNQVGAYSVPSENDTYGTTPGNLGNLPAGTLDGGVTSPPWAGVTSGHDHAFDETAATVASRKQAGPLAKEYGHTPGQLGNLPAGSLDGCVTSPPYADIGAVDVSPKDIERMKANEANGRSTRRQNNSRAAIEKQLARSQPEYGQAEGQLGNLNQPTYWQAVAQIYSEVRKSLKPGGVLAVVVKSYVAKGKIVDLPAQTATLLSRLGFTVFLEVRALLTATTTHPGLFGEVTKKREKKSFFRRLAEKKGSPAIDHETVLFARKE